MNLFFLTTTLHDAAGIAAFLLGVVQLICGFLLFVRLGAGLMPDKRLLLAFFTTGLLSNLFWLYVLWPGAGFFICSESALATLCYGILLIQCSWLSGKSY